MGAEGDGAYMATGTGTVTISCRVCGTLLTYTPGIVFQSKI